MLLRQIGDLQSNDITRSPKTSDNGAKFSEELSIGWHERHLGRKKRRRIVVVMGRVVVVGLLEQRLVLELLSHVGFDLPHSAEVEKEQERSA